MLTIKLYLKIVFFMVFLMALIGCTPKTKPIDQKTSAPILRISTDMSDEPCGQRRLENKILYISSRYCPKCKQTSSVIEDIIRKEGLESYYIPLDITTAYGMKQLRTYDLEVQFVPTLIVNCMAYVGQKPAEQYNNIMKAFKYGH